MDTDDFVMCLRRFINRTGDVKEIRCDNGSNFVGAQRELKESLRNGTRDRLRVNLFNMAVNGYFNPNCIKYIRCMGTFGS